MSRPKFEQTRAFARSLKSTAKLIKERDTTALYAKELKRGLCEEADIRNFLLRDLYSVAALGIVLASDTLDESTNLYERMQTRLGNRQNDNWIEGQEFGPVTITPLNHDYHPGYRFLNGNRQIGFRAIELHLFGSSGTSSRDALRGLGSAAIHIGETPELLERGNVVGISYPELIRATLRLGMRPVPVEVTQPGYMEEIRGFQTVFHLMNGTCRPTVAEPAASYLPTPEFVEVFSRFAEPANA